MIKARLKYFLLIPVIIALGMLSRKYHAIPLWIGDVLWATMVYFIVRFFDVKSTIKKIAIITLLISYAVEFSQLYKAEWLNSLRHNFFGHLVLGETFFWGDLLSYTAGVLIGIAIDSMLARKYS